MRILFVANTLPPHDLSGAGEQVVQLAQGLREAGHDVEVLGRGPGGAAGPKVLFALTVVLPAWRALRRLRPDVVQVHESDAGLVALLVRALRALRLLRPRPRLLALLQVSYVREIRSTRPLTDGTRVFGVPGAAERRFRWTKGPVQVALGWLSARLADRVVAPSRRTGEELVADYGVRAFGVLPNVTGGLEPAELREDRVRRPEGYLLYVGRLRVRKGVEVLYHALAEGAGVERARLLVAGSGEQEDSLDRLAERLDLGDRVERLGRADAGEVRALMSRASALVVPSTYEGMPLVILEAMKAGLPIVASAVSGIPEVVVDGETGWLVAPERPLELAEALAEVLGDPAEARRRGEAGRDRVESLYTPERAAATWLEEVAELG